MIASGITPGIGPADPGASPVLPARPRDGVVRRAFPTPCFNPCFEVALEVNHAARPDLHELWTSTLDTEHFEGVAAATDEGRSLLGG